MTTVLHFNHFLMLKLTFPFLGKNIYRNHDRFMTHMLDLTFLLLNSEKEQECLFYGLKVNSFWFVTISFFLFKMNFSLNHTSSTMFKFTSVFRVSSYSLSVVFYDMTKMKQNQNISCYKFIISLV